MTKHTKPESADDLNSAGIMRAVATAMLHMGKLQRDQKVDLILAAMHALKVTICDDLTHSIGIGRISNDEVVDRLVNLAVGIEETRSAQIGRFAMLCEMLKPEVTIEIQIKDPE